MRTKTAAIIFFGLLFFLISKHSSSMDNRLKALGNLQLAVPDSENQLGFYYFGKNPAGLVYARSGQRMNLYWNSRHTWGDYHRLYDPLKEQDYSLKFEGVKTMNKKETFWGSVTYMGDYPRQVYRSLEQYPYRKNFILTDTTTGNFWYNGPVISAVYSRKLPFNFSVGAAFNYKVQMGLKNVYTKVESIRWAFFPGIGIAWRLKQNPTTTFKQPFSKSENSKIGLGFFVFPYNSQTRLTAVKELQDALLYRQIGLDTRFQQVRSKYIRIYRTKGLILGGQMFLSLGRHSRLGIAHFYRSSGNSVTDNLFIKRGYEQMIFNRTTGRLVYQKNGFRIAGQMTYSNREDWSKTIEYGSLYGENNQNRFTAGIGFGLNRKWIPAVVGAEIYWGHFSRNFKDYLAHQSIAAEANEWEFRTGAEFPLFRGNWRLRVGGNAGEKVPGPFFMYRRERFWSVSGGLGWRQPQFRVSIAAIYRSKSPKGKLYLLEQPAFNGARFLPGDVRRNLVFQFMLQLYTFE
ncbi:hypothetical protein BMS3Abin05_02056 [bacterium BMS3Abin05]|nr:hypothetical protein BMS3Abin05_02056 [bacterium BMS3Abin05]GBE27643.1 hypothetical protein BMS3Bbin03_01571 [bacterium BMS3Bbin03]HDZ10819.1 hypothetical protein [Bacteroidota bacterium]